MAEEELRIPSCLHLVSAFLAMEPPLVLISLARDCGGGSITERVQSFIWDHCISKADEKCHAPYLKSFLKKVIVEVESKGCEVLDEIYERFSYYMSSLKDDDSAKVNSKIMKHISFLFPDEGQPCPESRKLVVSLQCSLNMLEGDTGCSIWPSSLFLSEFILSYPQIFSNTSCFEVGSGVGLVGVCLGHVKASKVVLSDGDLSCLANMKLNLELNQLSVGPDLSKRGFESIESVKCIHLPWESAVGTVLQDFKPDIILGADVIYNPSCLPDLVEVLASLLNREESEVCPQNKCLNGIEPSTVHINGETLRADNAPDLDTSQGKAMCGDVQKDAYASLVSNLSKGPLAFIASVIRNIDTFNLFLALSKKASLKVEDVTETFHVLNLLPYMHSYDRSCIRLFVVTHLRD